MSRPTAGKYPPYPAYKDSGVEWLGAIPAHWQVKRLRFACQINPSKGEMAALPRNLEASFLPMEKIGEDGTLILDETRSIEQVWQGYTCFRDSDVIVAKITPCFENGKGALCRDLVNGIGFGTTELHVLRTRQEVDPRFIFYLTKSNLFRTTGIALMYGAAGQQRVSDDFVRDFRVAVPSLHEQHAIAAFLDRETQKIDALVAKKERLIALLQEKRAALISHAVTKGLNPDAPMKDSGIAWLGEIPAHWAVAPVYSRYRVQLGKMLDSARITGEHLAPYLRNVDVQWDSVNVDNLPQMDFSPSDRERFLLREGDLLVCEGGEVGRATIWRNELPECYYQKALHRLRPFSRSDQPRFMYYILYTAVGLH